MQPDHDQPEYRDLPNHPSATPLERPTNQAPTLPYRRRKQPHPNQGETFRTLESWYREVQTCLKPASRKPHPTRLSSTCKTTSLNSSTDANGRNTNAAQGSARLTHSNSMVSSRDPSLAPRRGPGQPVTLGPPTIPRPIHFCHNNPVATLNTSVRQSVSLPSRIAKRVLALAETRHTSASRILVDLIETGLQAKQAQHQRFFELTDQLAESTDPTERKRLQEELTRLTCCK